MDVTVFDIKPQQLYRILNCPELTQELEFLVINDPEDPYKPYEPNEYLDEYQDGQIFQISQRRLMNMDELIDLIIGLILYADQSYTDVHSQNNIEPVLCTLGIFNQKTLCKSIMWIILRYMTDLVMRSAAGRQEETHKEYLKGMHCWIYHQMMDAIVEGIRDLQGSIIIKTRLCRILKLCKIVFTLISIDGDGKAPT
jgi:hypothetical protein